MTDKEFLLWVADRIVFIYDENEDVQFISRLVSIAHATPETQSTRVTKSWEPRSEYAKKLYEERNG